jgi:methionyl-tRNA formyltransferase
MKNNFVFFGSSKFSCIILDELEKAGLLPSLIVTGIDKPQGRKLVLTSPPTKMWADAREIPCLQPAKISDEAFQKLLKAEASAGSDLFIVASYGKIIPRKILDIPTYSTLNVHPSLLPKLRGATPIQSAILSENETGVSIMLLDEEMDHGPILAQEVFVPEKSKAVGKDLDWPMYADLLEEKLARLGGALLAKIIPEWIEGNITPVLQNHAEATYTKKITKVDGLINLEDDAEKNLRKIRAYAGWPTAYFFLEKNKKKTRVVIKEAELVDGKLVITKVIPEGKKEMSYEDFLRGSRQ